MSVKALKVTEDAYRRLRAQKRGAESFTEVIVRITSKPALASFVGSLPKASAERLRRVIAADREQRSQADKSHTAR
ncbi:MAG: antitoxin VapB family protein [Thermoplasmata archaeon]